MTRALQINLKQRINSALNNEQKVISSKWFYKNYLISHSNSSKLFCWGNCVCMVCFYIVIVKSRWIQSLNAQHSRLNMSTAMHSACSKHWIKIVSKIAQYLLLNQVEGRLKSLKIQHRSFSWLTTIQLSFSKEYSHAPKMLSHISNRPRVAYLVLVTLISHG